MERRLRQWAFVSVAPLAGVVDAIRVRDWLRANIVGPKLQFLNLSIFFLVVNLTVDYPNRIEFVALCVATAALLDGVASRLRYGGWRIPWPSMVGALGACMLVDGPGWEPFVLLPVLMIGSKHLIRYKGVHLFNPNNFAIALLILAMTVRVGVNDWGDQPHTLALMLLFGTIATTRVKRFDLALMYLGASYVVFTAVSFAQGWGWQSAFVFAFSPLQVLIAFFAITDPTTSPSDRVEKFLWVLLIVLVSVPATLSSYDAAPVFALFVAAPQRHLVRWLVATWRGTTPRAGAVGGAA